MSDEGLTTAQTERAIPVLGEGEVIVDPLEGVPGSFTLERRKAENERWWSRWTIHVDAEGIPKCEECGASEWTTRTIMDVENPTCAECGFMPRQDFRRQLKAALGDE